MYRHRVPAFSPADRCAEHHTPGADDIRPYIRSELRTSGSDTRSPLHCHRNFEPILVVAGDKPDIFCILQLRISLFHLPENLSAAAYLLQHLRSYRRNGKTVKLGNLLKCYHPCAFFQRRRPVFIQHIPANVSLGGLHLLSISKQWNSTPSCFSCKKQRIIHQITLHSFSSSFLPPNSSLNACCTVLAGLYTNGCVIVTSRLPGIAMGKPCFSLIYQLLCQFLCHLFSQCLKEPVFLPERKSTVLIPAKPSLCRFADITAAGGRNQ